MGSTKNNVHAALVGISPNTVNELTRNDIVVISHILGDIANRSVVLDQFLGEMGWRQRSDILGHEHPVDNIQIQFMR